jgi:hypothetical protein
MRDNILGRKEGSVNMRQARRNETRMVEACERRILEFPLDIDEREVAKQLKREGWYAWASNHDGIVLRIKRVRANAGSCRSGTIDFDLAVSGSFPLAIATPRATRDPWKKNALCAGSLRIIISGRF